MSRTNLQIKPQVLPRLVERAAADPDTSKRAYNDLSRGARFPLAGGLLLGLGIGGFFDGIVLHQILQWHHMLSSAGYPPDSLANLQFNTLADGLFHAAAYVFVLWGLALLWRASRQAHFQWSASLLVASMLMGFGIFNLVEGVVNHHVLGLHHVNETVLLAEWIYWDVGFLAWGAAMLVAGWAWYQRSAASLRAKPARPELIASKRLPTAAATAAITTSAASAPKVAPTPAAPTPVAPSPAPPSPAAPLPFAGPEVAPSDVSIAGEEDPGASLDICASPPETTGVSKSSVAFGSQSHRVESASASAFDEDGCNGCGDALHVGPACPACHSAGRVVGRNAFANQSHPSAAPPIQHRIPRP